MANDKYVISDKYLAELEQKLEDASLKVMDDQYFATLQAHSEAGAPIRAGNLPSAASFVKAYVAYCASVHSTTSKACPDGTRTLAVNLKRIDMESERGEDEAKKKSTTW
jgi:hypothetical protein